ncbi:membrane protein [Gallibacterium salpingitidis]|uniref:Membrane protein n=1 Tax=Gallibacterium salpingitidis TaxID=505341 RepID=A0AB36E1L5_9PAST|nr:outer membrane protein transport protein [Gallibacterium salpingitidis]OBX09497.1 membrane protein [Gallibacterium salpingitidis]
MRLLSKTLLASLVAVASQGAFASAFQLHETSTSGLGRAYAGDAAIAEDASVVASNPALMTFFKRPEISVGGIYVRPNIDLTGTVGLVSSRDRETFINTLGSADHNDIATKEVIPYLYTVYPINDRFSIGGGVNVNYGLATEFNDDYSAGLFGGKTDLTTLNFNLSGAYRVTNNFSIGAGLNAVYADAVVERRIGALGTLRGAAPSTVASKLEGDKWGYGWNVGAVYEFNENNRIGLAYHSFVDIKFNGEYSSQANPLKNGSGSLTLPLPAYWDVAGYHRLLPKFAVTYSVKRTEWSRFKELYAHRNGSKLFQKNENFSDTTRIALGFIYDVDDKLTLRAGVAHDETAVSKGYHSISIPDTDRTWYTLGATYRFTPNLSLDAGFAFIKGKNLAFTEVQDVDGVPEPVGGKFDSKSTATLYGLGLNYRF